MIKLVFYKASKGNWWDRAIGLWTWGPYSHVEFQFSDGICFSSSPRDGGTRFKYIDTTDGKWDTIVVDGIDESRLREWCQKEVGVKYDWFGILGFVIPFVNDRDDMWYCSEICSAGLNTQTFRLPTKIHPNKLAKLLKK